MAGFSNGNSHKVTPNRRTVFQGDVPEVQVNRQPWSKLRQADNIAREESNGFGVKTNCMLISGLGLCLTAHQINNYRLKSATVAGSLRVGVDWNTVSNVVEHHFSAKEADLTGLTWSGEVAAQADWLLHKKTNQSTSYATSLTADIAALPSYPRASNDVDHPRIAASNKNYPANTAFHISLWVPPHQALGHDNIATIYYGGPAEVQPSKKPTSGGTVTNPGGTHAVHFKGNGWAEVGEFINGTWHKVTEFAYAAPNAVAGFFHQLWIGPAGKSVSMLAAPNPKSAQSVPSMVSAKLQPPPSGPSAIVIQRYRGPDPSVPVKKTHSGPGPFRIEANGSLDIKVNVSIAQYPSSGTIIDHPFEVSQPVLGGVPIFCYPRVDAPAGTAVTYKIRDASTRAVLTQDTNGNYLANANQNYYYVEFTLTTSDPTKTPYLKGYKVKIQGARTTDNSTPFSGGNIRNVSISGGDEDPTHATAHLEIKDVKNQLSTLRYREGVHGRIICYYDTVNNPTRYTVLHEGETRNQWAHKKGKARKEGFAFQGGDRNFPSPEWRDIQFDIISMWDRLNDTISFTMEDYNRDESTVTTVEGKEQYQPWKLTDAIRDLLEKTGLPPEQMDIPDLPTRLFTSGESNEFVFQPLARVVDIARSLARDYLGGWLTWDGNAQNGGLRGMARLHLPPTAYTSIYSFYTTPITGSTPTSFLGSAAYGSNSTFITEYETKPVRPEANYVATCSSGQYLPNNGGPTLQFQYAYNPLSYNWDAANPTAFKTTNNDGINPNPHYLGRQVSVVYYDPTIQTREGLNWMCRRLYTQTCLPRKMIHFTAPLVFVGSTTTGDSLQIEPRMLQRYDCITINGYQALVMNCNPDYRVDSKQMMEVQAQFITDGF